MGVNEINECDVKMVFPLIVECEVTNPTTDISSDGSITLLINGGTPPYDITWNDGNIGTTLINLTQGSYTAVVVDYYGVSATTTCSLVRPEPTTTTTTTTSPPEPELYDICVVITNGGITYDNFQPDGYYNSKNAWISDDTTKRIVWDDTLNYWYISGSSYNIINTNTTYPPINGWELLGSPATVSVSLGECIITSNLSGSAVVNNPTCSCDGTITLTPLNGVPPYQYSINNGNTFGDSPLFNGLCGGIYTWIIKDSEDNTFSGVNTLSEPSPITTYTLNINLISPTNDNQLVGQGTLTHQFSIQVNPPLPVGITLTFNVGCRAEYSVSPNPDSYLVTVNNTLTKNSVTIPNDGQTSIYNTTPMTSPCNLPTNYVYRYDDNTTWVGVTMTSGDVIILTSNTTSTYNCENSTPEDLGLYEIEGTYSFDLEEYGSELFCCESTIYNKKMNISNIQISGCQCCNATSLVYFYNRA